MYMATCIRACSWAQLGAVGISAIGGAWNRMTVAARGCSHLASLHVLRGSSFDPKRRRNLPFSGNRWGKSESCFTRVLASFGRCLRWGGLLPQHV